LKIDEYYLDITCRSFHVVSEKKTRMIICGMCAELVLAACSNDRFL